MFSNHLIQEEVLCPLDIELLPASAHQKSG